MTSDCLGFFLQMCHITLSLLGFHQIFNRLISLWQAGWPSVTYQAAASQSGYIGVANRNTTFFEGADVRLVEINHCNRKLKHKKGKTKLQQ